MLDLAATFLSGLLIGVSLASRWYARKLKEYTQQLNEHRENLDRHIEEVQAQSSRLNLHLKETREMALGLMLEAPRQKTDPDLFN